MPLQELRHAKNMGIVYLGQESYPGQFSSSGALVVAPMTPDEVHSFVQQEKETLVSYVQDGTLPSRLDYLKLQYTMAYLNKAVVNNTWLDVDYERMIGDWRLLQFTFRKQVCTANNNPRDPHNPADINVVNDTCAW
jgi:hypothetical protein